MIPAARLTALAVLFAPWLGGCTVLDTRTLDISVFDASQSHLQVVVLIDAMGFDQVRFEIDGSPAGTFPASGVATIDTSRLVQGEHVLTARAVTGRPVDEASLRFQVVVPPPAVVRVEPAYGPVPGDAPLTILVEFSEPVFDDAVEPLRLDGDQFGSTVVTRTPSADGRSLRFQVDDPSSVNTLSVVGQVRNARGSALRLSGFPGWSVQWFVGTLGSLEAETHVSGLIRLNPGVLEGVVPPSAEVLVDGRVVHTLGAPPWAPFDLDTAVFPEGRHVASIRASGFGDRRWWGWPVLVVDRSPPAATCQGSAYRAPEASSQLGIRECVRILFSEPVRTPSGGVLLLDDGTVLPSEARWSSSDDLNSGGINEIGICPLASRAQGATEQVMMAAVRDLAGNPVTPDTCTLSVPPILAPWGAGPLSEWGFEPRASRISVTGWQGTWRVGQPWWAASVAMVEAADSVTPGNVLVLENLGPEPYRSYGEISPTHGISTGVTISDDRVLVVKPVGAGSRDVVSYLLPAGRYWTASTTPLDAFQPDDADEPVVRANPGCAVWTEGPRGGIRKLQGAEVLVSPDVWTPLAGDPRGSVTGSAALPSLTIHRPASSPSVALVAFLETAPAGAPRLRAASVELGGGAWIPGAGDLDLGLGPPADPAIAMAGDLPALAWIEDGQVWVRMGTLDATGLAFGPAVALNHDPALPARAARLIATLGARATLLFVESGPSGDHLWARRWDGTTWVLQPGPINEGTGNVIAELSADGLPDAQGVVAWTDALGRVYLRVLNW